MPLSGQIRALMYLPAPAIKSMKPANVSMRRRQKIARFRVASEGTSAKYGQKEHVPNKIYITHFS